MGTRKAAPRPPRNVGPVCRTLDSLVQTPMFPGSVIPEPCLGQGKVGGTRSSICNEARGTDVEEDDEGRECMAEWPQ